MVMNPLVAVTAGLPAASVGGGGKSGQGFGALLGEALAKLNGLQLSADSQLQQLAQGKGNLATVVEATSQANLGLELAGQVRNEMIQAYQSLMNMQV